MEVRLPRLKLDYDKDESFSLGRLSLPLIIGFGAHWSWVYLTMFSGKTIFFWNAAEPDSVSFTFYLISLISLVLTLFSYGVFSRVFRQLFATAGQRSRNRLIGATFAAGGTAFMCFADNADTTGMALLVIGAIATGIGSAVLLMSYGVSFGQCDIATIVTSTALSLIVGIVLYAVIFNFTAPFPLRAILTASIPFLECYCLYMCSSVLVDKLEFAEITLKVRKAPLALRLGIPSVLFGFALGSTRTEAITDMGHMGDVGMQIACIAFAAIIVCILMIAAMLTQRQNLNFMFRTLLPLVTAALLWIYFDTRHSPFITALVFLCCYLMFESILWVNYSDISQRFRLTAFIVFGFGRGSLALGTLIGGFIAALNRQAGFELDVDSTSTVSLGCMLIAFALLPSESEIGSLIIGESDNPVGDMRAHQRTEEPKSEETIRAGRFKLKCETVANRYLLSKKETEVLFLLAKGRNAAYIQEQLYISEGTARTHMRHIYKKLDVHTQQELIDLVDSV